MESYNKLEAHWLELTSPVDHEDYFQYLQVRLHISSSYLLRSII